MTAPKSREPVERLAYNVSEVAAAIGRSDKFVLEAIYRGDLRATALPGPQRKRTAWIIPAESLTDFIQGRRNVVGILARKVHI